GSQAKQIYGKRSAVKVEVDVARSRNANALDALDGQQSSGKLFGNLARGLAKLFGQLETGGNRELSHFDGGRIAQDRHTRVTAEDFSNDLDKPVANSLLEFQIQVLSLLGVCPDSATLLPLPAIRPSLCLAGFDPRYKSRLHH